MAMTEVLAVVTGPGQDGVLGTGEMLASRWGGRVTVLLLEQLPEPIPGDEIYSSGLWAELVSQARERFVRDRDSLRKRLDKLSVNFEFRHEETMLPGVEGLIAKHAMHADITVLAASKDAPLEAAFEGALFKSGRPVLLVPMEEMPPTIGKRIVVAWKAKREAARALADAEPFLREADQITVVTVDANPDGYGEGPGRDISTYLAHKGFKVELCNVDGLGQPAEVALIREARALEADLIVMGGYGHSRLREFVFGGVTRALSRNAAIPVLMSH
ncbi:MAG: universal stress protein [Hyphomonadaceae bacterium]